MHQAIRAVPRSPYYHNYLGVLLSHKGDPTGAETEYREAIRLEPKYAMAHANLGSTLMDAHRQPEGVKEINTAYQLDPKNPEISAVHKKYTGKNF
jgi:lipoprotein NlpI